MSKSIFAILALVAAPVQAAVTVDRDHFFKVCASLHDFEMDADKKDAHPAGISKLKPQHLPAINDIIDRWEVRKDDDLKRLAFILATARRESEGRWDPIREAPGCSTETCREQAIGRLLKKRADARGVKPRPNYALPAANGQRYYGRGYIQLTFESSYAQADKKMGTGTLLHDNPDKVMDRDIAVKILVDGMLEGWFGNKQPLSTYLNANKADWINARNNVNPGSPNKPITARSAQEIYACLRPAAG